MLLINTQSLRHYPDRGIKCVRSKSEENGHFEKQNQQDYHGKLFGKNHYQYKDLLFILTVNYKL